MFLIKVNKMNPVAPQDAVVSKNPNSNDDKDLSSETKVIIETKFGVKPTYQPIVQPLAFNSDGLNEAQSLLLPKFMVSMMRVELVIFMN